MTMNSETTVCPKCSKDFDTHKSMISHHSAKQDDKHTGSLLREEENCANCGDAVEYLPSQRSGKIFCDGSCRSTYFTEDLKNKEQIECKGCGKTFEDCPSNNRKYCSTECYNTFSRDGRYKDGERVSKSCDWCNTEFTRLKCKIKTDNVFCSTTCRDNWVSENMTGKNHPRWVDGERTYGPNWDNIRNRCLERDFNRCRICKETENLHVHHKIPARTFDDYSRANKMYNLITLCASCHRKEESKIIEV